MAKGFARLDPDRPPGDVPLKRWRRFVDDVKRFLDSEFCAVAVALGWGSHDLFGCDADRPFARVESPPNDRAIYSKNHFILPGRCPDDR